MTRTNLAVLVTGSLAVVAGSAGVEAQVPVSFPTRDGGVVHATEAGTGIRAVILAHGGRFTKESWSAQLPAFVEAGFRTVVIDFRGRGESRGGAGLEVNQDSAHLDVLAAYDYLVASGAESVSIVGASFGGWASARATTVLPAGAIDALILLAHSPIGNPERLHGRKLFITTRDDVTGDGRPRLPSIRDQHDRAPDPKELMILPGSAHAQFIFDTEQGPALLGAIVRFLSHRSEALEA